LTGNNRQQEHLVVVPRDGAALCPIRYRAESTGKRSRSIVQYIKKTMPVRPYHTPLIDTP
jgi:hypothetical protein